MSDMSHCLGRLIESKQTSWDFFLKCTNFNSMCDRGGWSREIDFPA